MNKGKLIVIDGVDSSGKETQVKKLEERLIELGYPIKRISFPNYESNSSALVKMYLNGDLGTEAENLDPFAISTFYAADRYISYITSWKKDLDEGKIVIADRYVTSNMIHQASKIKDEYEKKCFLDWLHKFEYEIYKLPLPDLTLFLNMPVEYGLKLMESRKNKITGEAKKDIHENNIEYLKHSYDNAMNIASIYNWNIVDCIQNDKIKSIETISNEILTKVLKII